jgi:hypothetical protein
MKAEKALAAILDADAGVTALVGTKVYGCTAPEDEAPPMLIYAKQSAEREPYLDEGTHIVRARLLVLCVALTYTSLKDLGEAVRLALRGKAGTYGGVLVEGTELSEEGPDEYEPGLKEFAQSFVYTVTFAE